MDAFFVIGRILLGSFDGMKKNPQITGDLLNLVYLLDGTDALRSQGLGDVYVN